MWYNHSKIVTIPFEPRSYLWEKELKVPRDCTVTVLLYIQTINLHQASTLQSLIWCCIDALVLMLGVCRCKFRYISSTSIKHKSIFQLDSSSHQNLRTHSIRRWSASENILRHTFQCWWKTKDMQACMWLLRICRLLAQQGIKTLLKLYPT